MYWLLDKIQGWTTSALGIFRSIGVVLETKETEFPPNPHLLMRPLTTVVTDMGKN